MSAQYGVPVAHHCKVINKEIKTGDELDGEVDATVAHFKSNLSMEDGKYYYGMQVVTGTQLGAGTSEYVYVSLVGSRGQTGKVSLQGFLDVFMHKITRHTYENFTIVSDKDLGEILVVTVGCSEAFFNEDWYVSEVAVVNLMSDSVQHFPCYHWIAAGHSVSFTANTTTLKHIGDCQVLLQQRTEQIRQRQELYQWKMFPENRMPSGIDDSISKLPPDEQFGLVKEFDFTKGAVESFGTVDIKALFTTADDLSAYQKLADTLGGTRQLYQAGRWTSDVEFGRQMLNGVNPIIIRKCTNLPGNFPVTSEMVKPFLVRELCLEDEMKRGHVYICDLSSSTTMEGLESRKGYFNVAPICLLYVNGSGQLVPIAIQVKQGTPIFLPSDNWIDWLRAKIYYKSAHSQYHQIFTHYTSCHATMEAFAMGTQRNLPDPHPIFKLLRPHIRYTMAINTRARATLINKGGIIDGAFGCGGPGLVELMKRAGNTYNIHTANIKKFVKERGADDAKQLPGYYYRDDGIKVWNALEVYAKDIIDEFYQTDDEVKEDKELQNWAIDLHTNGFHSYSNEPEDHGFPSSISTKEELIDLCTLIMFTGSAQHASVNFMQYHAYKFVPNAPFGVRRPPPVKKGEVDYLDLMETLPNEWSAVQGIAITHLLSQYSADEEYLGSFKARFRETKAENSIQRLQSSLKKISADILLRNDTLDVPYTGMLPEKVPNSITI